MAKIQNKPHLTNFIKQNYIWILMIVTMSCIHLLYMYLIGARKQDLVYAAVLDAILLLITVLVGFFRYSSKVKALSNALKRPVEEQAQLPEATDDVENDFVLEKVSVDGVIRDTIKKYAKIMIRRHIGINYSGTGQEVYTDGKWLAFMLEQILSNAIKYTPQGVVTIETAEEKDRFFITIKDTGIGIKAEDLPRVFEKGYTGYNGHADKKATGIGLYLCRQMAEKLGHTIHMESEIGKGTKVWIGFDLDYADTRD